jgi:hypothetical protein
MWWEATFADGAVDMRAFSGDGTLMRHHRQPEDGRAVNVRRGSHASTS